MFQKILYLNPVLSIFWYPKTALLMAYNNDWHSFLAVFGLK